MPKLSRIYQRLFGSTAAPTEIGKFGSLAAGSPQTTTDPDQMQSLANWLGGWNAAVVGSNSPTIEDMNAVHYVYAYQLAYLMQSGVPEYDSSTTYYIDSIVQYGGLYYRSLTDNNTGNTPSVSINWEYMYYASKLFADNTGHNFLTGSTIQNQLSTADQYLVPTGTILSYAGVTAPSNFLICDGSAISRSTYSRLFTAISTVYGSGNGVDTFNIPDLRYSFMRGYAPNISVTGSGTASATVTFTDATDLVTFANHGLTDGSIIQFKTITTTAGISINTNYYVINASTNTFQLASTYNGSALPLTNNGTGVFKDHAVFTNHGINRTGMKVRLSSGTLSGLGGGTDYYAIVINQNNLAFATSYANAMANTRITISGANSGVIIQWEDPDIASRALSSVGGSTGIGSRQDYTYQSHSHGATIYGNFGAGGTAGPNGNDGGGIPWSRSDKVGISASGGNETRPMNTYVNYIIKT